MIFNIEKKSGLNVELFFEDFKSDDKLVNKLKELKLFTGKLNEVYFVRNEETDRIFLGLGKEADLGFDEIRNAFFSLGCELKKQKVNEIQLNMPKLNNICFKKTACAVTEGLLHSTYSFSLKSKKDEEHEIIVNYNHIGGKTHKIEEGVSDGKNLIESIFLTRELVNLPANYIYPETLAKRAVEELEPLGVKVTVYDEKQIEELNMQAYLSVARGSARRPSLIVMEYMNDPTTEFKTALVGKGVTYDSGGYAIKPANYMDTMFCDMGGAGTVIGTLKALALNNSKTNVVGVIAACENLIDGNAYKNGDIIGSMSGKTIQILNTDAEGRLTLADAIHYATVNLNADRVIDLATLTGACVVALGEDTTAIISNNDEFVNELKIASERAGEPIWQLPASKCYKEMNKSDVADLKNIGGQFAGTITAGLFVGEFVKEGTPWIHMDIAGTAYLSSKKDYRPKGATGIHVKTLYYLLTEETC